MLLARKKKVVRIGPTDDGREMSLDDFSEAIPQGAYLYELAKGVIQVSQVPHPQHERQIAEIRKQLTLWEDANPGHVELIAGAMGAKLLVGASESERHPDVCIYLSPQPEVEDVWSLWIPEIVIEVVSESSAKRDYEEKPPEYLELGVKENWIIDKKKNQMLALIRWRGQWKKSVVKPSQKFSTELLPGFKLDLKRIFAAAK